MDAITETIKAPSELFIAVDIEAFDLITANMGHDSDAKRSRALNMDHGVMSRLRTGEIKPGLRFITRTIALGIPFNGVFRLERVQ